MAPETYHHIVHWPLFGQVDLHFLMNEIFMVFFFGIAAKEITESCLPGGALNPIRKAINPLFGTVGGVLGPIGVYFALVAAFGHTETYGRGWGIPTATDIALAWLVARMVFGKSHPAVNFLLLLAVADDAIGMGIIAVFYPDPSHPVSPMWLTLTAGAGVMAFVMRRLQIQEWTAYVFGPGILSWLGLYLAHLHPALALVFVVPFLPSAKRDLGLFQEDVDEHAHHSPLEQFEHSMKTFVDFGLFFFAFCNAGVEFSDIGPATWYVLSALVIGKTVGITGFSWVADRAGFPLPRGMQLRHLVVAGLVASMGLTVALFVAGEAFEGGPQLEAKMGALLSGLGAVAALVAGRMLKLKSEIPEEIFDVEPDAGIASELASPVVVESAVASDGVAFEREVDEEEEREGDVVLH
ncbi:MAG: Na+/H+ antiporter NhaA [Planctomycetes bacterium]|nr:Na+/H+ antiporter NhaA [Planctomycetota bacterium]